MVADTLAARTDGLVDYEELYRLLLKTPPPQVNHRELNTNKIYFAVPPNKTLNIFRFSPRRPLETFAFSKQMQLLYSSSSVD